jgi:hypothetical protein
LFSACAFAVLLVALIVSPASATKTHLFKEAFGSAAQPTFGDVSSVAVDQSTGAVLVMDAGGTPSIKRYNADGTPLNFGGLDTNAIDGQGTGNCATVPADCDETPQNGLSFGSYSESQIAVDNSGGATDGNIYVTQGSPNLINIFSAEGEYIGQLTAAGATPFTEACGVAVDSAGAVFVGDYSGGIHKFVPAANPPVDGDNTATFTTTTQPCAIAAGAGPTAGFIFPAEYNGAISKVDSSTGELKYVVSSDSNTTVAVDPSTGHVYGLAGSTVKEFDASAAGSATMSSSFSLPAGGRGIAIRGSTDNVYVSREGDSTVEVFGPLVTLADVTTGSATAITPTSATLNGTVNPDGAELTECKFEYGKTSAYGQSIPCAQSPATIGSGTSDVSVSADVSGLDLGDEYHFHLVAANANGTVDGSDESFKLQSPPVVGETWSEDVSFVDATLKAKINPEGFATTYKFEWGETTAYGDSKEGTLDADEVDHEIGFTLAGLKPGTTYHYRVVTTNTIGTAEGPDLEFVTYLQDAQDTACPNQVYRYGAAADLPDCRAYEMVSPIDKNGSDAGEFFPALVYESFGYAEASTSGDKFTFTAPNAFAGAVSAPLLSQYISTRSAGDWSTQAINAPKIGPDVGNISSQGVGPYKYFSPDLDTAWMVHFSDPLNPAAPTGVPGLYSRDNLNGSYVPLTVGEPPTNEYWDPDLQGLSKDGTHVVFALNDALTPDAPLVGQNDTQLYEWVNGSVRLVSVLPNGEPAPGRSGAGGPLNPSIAHDGWVIADHAVSDDGSTIFWTTDYFNGEDGGTIYARLNGVNTIPVSESVTTGRSRFWAANADGSSAVFQVLDGPNAEDLFEFDVETETSTLIAHESNGVLGAADDLSYLYFISREVLGSGATASQPNLYVRHEGGVTFVGTLSKSDAAESTFNSVSGAIQPYPSKRTAQVSADGLHAVFTSDRSLTGYDNVDADLGKPATEVYRYDAVADELDCVSCTPSGARPRHSFEYQGSSGNIVIRINAWVTPARKQLYEQRVLSADGSRVFFNSRDGLLPQDTNGATDVYQWEEQGAGSCDDPQGCLSLISTGRSSEGAKFFDASPNGDDVFFVTRGSIDPRDPGLVDVYDARVNGGLVLPPAPPEPCVGDSCQAAPTPPLDPTPASATFKGQGNAKPRSNRCGRQGTRAAKLARSAASLSRRAGQASSPTQAERLSRRARSLKEKVQQMRKRATRCRRAERRAAG